MRAKLAATAFALLGPSLCATAEQDPPAEQAEAEAEAATEVSASTEVVETEVAAEAAEAVADVVEEAAEEMFEVWIDQDPKYQEAEDVSPAGATKKDDPAPDDKSSDTSKEDSK